MITQTSRQLSRRGIARALTAACFGFAGVMAATLSPQALAQDDRRTPARTAPADHPYLTLEALRARYQDRDSRYAVIDGLRIHYKDQGPRGAPVLFMIHGSESSLRTWDAMVPELDHVFRVVRFDIPGFGLSDSPRGDMQGVDPTEIPAKLLARLGVKTATVIGVSSGGTMAMYLAAKHPALVDRLILSNTPSDPVDTSHLVMSPAFVAAQQRAAQTGFRDQDFWNRFLSFFAGDPTRIDARTRREYYDFYRRTTDANKLALVAKIGDGKAADMLMGQITAPTLLLWGGADPLLPISAVDAIAHHLVRAQISRMVMPDVGHYPPLETPQRFAAVVKAYVTAIVPAAALKPLAPAPDQR